MAELSPYTVTINGIEHTMKLDEQTAKRLYGDAAVPVVDKGKSSGTDKSSDDVPNKARRTRQQ